jgi:ribosomal protein L37AE/L43A
MKCPVCGDDMKEGILEVSKIKIWICYNCGYQEENE